MPHCSVDNMYWQYATSHTLTICHSTVLDNIPYYSGWQSAKSQHLTIHHSTVLTRSHITGFNKMNSTLCNKSSHYSGWQGAELQHLARHHTTVLTKCYITEWQATILQFWQYTTLHCLTRCHIPASDNMSHSLTMSHITASDNMSHYTGWQCSRL